MGIFNGMVQLRDGGHQNALRPTNWAVFHPGNPGPFDTVRSVAIVPNTREFTPPEAAHLTVLAEQRSEIAAASEEAYRALSTIENADQRIHSSNRLYRGEVAKAELLRKQSDAKYLSTLNDLREGYGKSAAQLMSSRKASDQQLEVIEARTRQLLKGF